MKKLLPLLILFSVMSMAAVLPNLKISPSSKTPIDTSAVLEIASTTQGVLFPRMTSAQRTAISSPANGLLVYDTDNNTIMEYIASTTSWSYLITGASALTPFRALYSDSTGAVTASTTTSLELSYLAGSGVTQGGVLYGNGSAYRVTAASTTGDVLMSAGTSTPIWHTPSSSNSANAIVRRDSNGDFNSRTITGETSLKTPSLLDTGAGILIKPTINQNLTFQPTATGRSIFDSPNGLDLFQITTPSNPTAGRDSLYFKSDDKLYKLTSGGVEAAVGSGGSGGINYTVLDSSYAINNQTDSDAETTIGNWLAYADAAGTVPVDMTGGSPNTTCLRTTTAGHVLNGTGSFEVVKSANNRQGEGCSKLFYIPPGYRGTNAQISMPFYKFSGSFSPGDITLNAYDVTNSSLIPVSFASTLSNGYLTGNLVISSSTAQLRAGFHFATASTTAVTFDFDDVFLSPPTNVGNVQVVSPWKNDLTFTPSGFGTVSATDYRYRQVGDTMEFQGVFKSGTVAASTAKITMPTGYTIDNSKITTTSGVQRVGEWTTLSNVDTDIVQPNISGDLFYDGSDTSTVYFASNVATFVYTKDNGSSTFSNSNVVTFKFKVPITQWSGSVTGFNAGQIANSLKATHASDCTFTTTSGTLADFAADATCTFEATTNNKNFGTVTSYTSAGNNLPGIVFTPSRSGRIWVCANVNGYNSIAGNNLYYQLNDVASSKFIAESFNYQHVANENDHHILCGAYDATGGVSTTLRIQGKRGAGTFTLGDDTAATNTITWELFYIDQQTPAPYTINSVVTPFSGVTQIVAAEVSVTGVVSAETGDWISGNCALASSIFTCTLNANIFSSTPVCIATPHGTTSGDATVNPASSTSVAVSTFVGTTGLAGDRAFSLMCMGPK